MNNETKKYYILRDLFKDSTVWKFERPSDLENFSVSEGRLGS